MTQITVDRRLQIGVEVGRTRPFVVADLGANLARGRNIEAGHQLFQQLLDAQLVCRIAKREDEADAHRLDTAARDFGGDAANLAFVERPDDRAGAVHALIDLENVVAADQGHRLGNAGVIHVLTEHTPHDQRVSQPLGGDEANMRALALQEGVGRDGGAVHEPVE